MTNVIRFPTQKEKPTFPLPRQRVFYIGYRYVGPTYCQGIQHLYLKRKGLVHGTRWWSMITYEKYDESERRPSSMELEKCEENNVPEMLEMFDMEYEVTLDGLRDMGWNGEVTQSANILYPDFCP